MATMRINKRWCIVAVVGLACLMACGPGDQRSATGTTLLLDRYEVEFTGSSPPIAFEVPADALSVTVTAVGEPTEIYFVDQWTQPDGSDLVSAGWYGVESRSFCVSCPNRVAVWIGAVAAVAPSSPAVALQPGRHLVRFGSRRLADDQPGATHVTVAVRAKTGPEVPVTGVLDLDLFLTGAGGITAATAAQDTTLQGYLTFVDNALSAAGIHLGKMTYHDVDPKFATITNLRTQLPAMFSAASGGEPDAANVFVVSTLPENRGFAPIPGSGPVGGVQLGGATVSLQHDKSPGLIMAHELGHYLGLFHTADSVGGTPVSDQLADTPDGDPAYLMNADAQDVVLSPSQGRQLRSSPWIR